MSETTIKCPHCGAEETTTIVDEHSLRQTCQVCGGVIEDTTNAEKIEAAKTKRFNGELMECMMCGKKQQHDPNVRSQWTVVGTDESFLCYVCPGCLQESDQAKRGHFATVYQKVFRRYTRLYERHIRGLNN